jgi:hypothetical protein
MPSMSLFGATFGHVLPLALQHDAEWLTRFITQQICSYLSPNDLLRISQSSKIFAAFLLAPSNAAVWRAARLQLDDGLPECPEDLTEQAYACLVFGTTCQVCMCVLHIGMSTISQRAPCPC